MYRHLCLYINKTKHIRCLAVCQKAFGSPTGYNFSRKIIIALSGSFRKQKLRKEDIGYVHFKGIKKN